MNIKPADEELLRQYLLGMLSEPEWDAIEQKLLTDDDFARTVEVIEDEIVDDYLDGKLSGPDKRAAEDHFFQSPEHRSKLHFARLLRRHLKKEDSLNHVRFMVPRVPQAFYWASSIAIVLLLSITTGLLIYTAKLNRDLQSQIAKNRSAEAELTRERTRASQLEAQLRLLQEQNDGPQTVAQDSSLKLTLLPVERSLGTVPLVKRDPALKWLEIHIAVMDFASPSYKASLRDANGREVWSDTNLKPKFSGKLLVFKIPAQLVSAAGEYSVVIIGSGVTHRYPFRVS